MKKELSPNTLIETLEYTIKGISVCVRIDYVSKKISVVERNGYGKRFLFNGRGPEYMYGWALVLDAIKEATQDAKKRLEMRIDEEEKEVDKLIKIIAEKKI